MAATWLNDTLVIRGATVPVRRGRLKTVDLNFYTENPRIYSLVHNGGQVPDQSEIERQLLSMDDVKELVQQIKSNGALLEPVIVRDGDYQVLEGNRRLAACRSLCTQDPIKWGTLPVVLLPKDIGQDKVFALLGEYHLKGKKEWAPYEQAGFVYRLHKEQGVPRAQLAEQLGMGPRRTSQLIDAFAFMQASGDKDSRRWSYYEEYVKSNRIGKLREKHPTLDKAVVRQIKSGAFERAADLRDKLPLLDSASPKLVQKYLAGEVDLYEAVERIAEAGNLDEVYRRLHKVRSWVSDPETKRHIKQAEGETRKKISYEVRKIQAAISMLAKVVG